MRRAEGRLARDAVPAAFHRLRHEFIEMTPGGVVSPLSRILDERPGFEAGGGARIERGQFLAQDRPDEPEKAGIATDEGMQAEVESESVVMEGPRLSAKNARRLGKDDRKSTPREAQRESQALRTRSHHQNGGFILDANVPSVRPHQRRVR